MAWIGALQRVLSFLEGWLIMSCGFDLVRCISIEEWW
jgi:hypothetical protein